MQREHIVSDSNECSEKYHNFLRKLNRLEESHGSHITRVVNILISKVNAHSITLWLMVCIYFKRGLVRCFFFSWFPLSLRLCTSHSSGENKERKDLVGAGLLARALRLDEQQANAKKQHTQSLYSLSLSAVVMLVSFSQKREVGIKNPSFAWGFFILLPSCQK